ncbi:PLD-like domain-containing protein [Fontimonas thermophila]|uniref:phospholipase D n=1 Tax=Fontimonas thermophila TaxID=1076937 RepID=A0A1I2H1S1_9GAMM|nr:phospholipase D family protein [Fontimonas thermophila]SFF22927.1 PLD-like domain-containing protein [Fontimonas thermophila]
MRARRTVRVLAAALLCTALALSAPAREVHHETSAVVGFSPQNGQNSAEDLVLQTIAQARSRIRVAMFTFSSRRIAKALVEARARGIDVAVVVDPDNGDGPRSALALLRAGGVGVRRNGHYARMHHKFMVVDGRHVQTGSYNYTYAAATQNAENVLLLRNAPALAAAYEREWQRLWNEAGAPDAAVPDGGPRTVP